MKKILCIGNSFSQDATTYLESITDDIFCRNLYVPGCSLETHVENLNGALKNYELQINGQKSGELVSINDTLKSEEWDYVTLQQCSGYSGKIESVTPYLGILIDYIQSVSCAKIVYHETWAYSKDSTHPHFVFYDNNQMVMFGSILGTTKKIEELYHLPIIRVGETIQRIRDNCDNVIGDMCRDGYHLSNEGRYVAAMVFARFFGAKINSYIPEELDKEKILKYLSFIK